MCVITGAANLLSLTLGSVLLCSSLTQSAARPEPRERESHQLLLNFHCHIAPKEKSQIVKLKHIEAMAVLFK